jgi:spore coat protein A
VGQGFGRAYTDPATEIPHQGDVEIWEIYNTSGDTHPIHFHLVNVQIINRQAFRVSNFNGLPATLLGPPRPPDANEFGWKETVRMNPGEVTRVIMRFDLPTVPFMVPSSPRAAALGITPVTGQTVNEYVWHCHILEHEEHDMMRPLVVIS